MDPAGICGDWLAGVCVCVCVCVSFLFTVSLSSTHTNPPFIIIHHLRRETPPLERVNSSISGSKLSEADNALHTFPSLDRAMSDVSAGTCVCVCVCVCVCHGSLILLFLYIPWLLTPFPSNTHSHLFSLILSLSLSLTHTHTHTHTHRSECRVCTVVHLCPQR